MFVFTLVNPLVSLPTCQSLRPFFHLRSLGPFISPSSRRTNQKQRPHMVGFYLHEISRAGKSIATESRVLFARGWREGRKK